MEPQGSIRAIFAKRVWQTPWGSDVKCKDS